MTNHDYYLDEDMVVKCPKCGEVAIFITYKNKYNGKHYGVFDGYWEYEDFVVKCEDCDAEFEAWYRKDVTVRLMEGDNEYMFSTA